MSVPYQAKMTHTQRRERRQQIAQALRSGKTPKEIMEEFKVSYATVYTVFKGEGLSLGPKGTNQYPSNQSFKILFLLLQGHTMNELAKEFRISYQRVHQIKQKAEEAGFIIHTKE